MTIEILPRVLTVDDFRKTPEQLSRWNYPEPITRESFTSFLVLSFAVSRGLRNAQLLYFRYIQLRTGCDVFGTIDSFVKAGGWICLTGKERLYFFDAFKKRTRHECYFDKDAILAIKEELHNLIKLKHIQVLDNEDIDVTDFDDKQFWETFNEVLSMKPFSSTLRTPPKP